MTNREKKEMKAEAKKSQQEMDTKSKEIAAHRAKGLASDVFTVVKTPFSSIGESTTKAVVEGQEFRIPVFDATFGDQERRFVNREDAKFWISEQKADFIKRNAKDQVRKRLRLRINAEFKRLNEILKTIANESIVHPDMHDDIISAMQHLAVFQMNIQEDGKQMQQDGVIDPRPVFEFEKHGTHCSNTIRKQITGQRETALETEK